MTVRDRDRGAAALVRKSGKRARVKVGVIGQEAAKRKRQPAGSGTVVSDETVIDIATKHEFGIGVPQRSFIAGYADESESINKRRLRNVMMQVIKGMPMDVALETFGLVIVGEMQERISNRIPPPLSQARIKVKGSDVPLIDTGQLRSSITHRVEGTDG